MSSRTYTATAEDGGVGWSVHRSTNLYLLTSVCELLTSVCEYVSSSHSPRATKAQQTLDVNNTRIFIFVLAQTSK